jgi:hypothetical protein
MHKVPFIVAELGSDIDPFVLHLFAALAQKERSLISSRTREGLKAARARGQTLGGWTAGSEASKRQADELAERMKPILTELAHLPSARQIAAEYGAASRALRAASGLPRLSAGYNSVSASVANDRPSLACCTVSEEATRRPGTSARAHSMDRVHRAGQHGTVRGTRPTAVTPRRWALAASPIERPSSTRGLIYG